MDHFLTGKMISYNSKFFLANVIETGVKSIVHVLEAISDSWKVCVGLTEIKLQSARSW